MSDPFEPEKKPGMSGGTKVLLILLGLGGICAIACCGAFGLFAVRLKEGITENPDEVRKRAAEIATIDIPVRFAPKAAVRFNMPLIPKMNICMFASGDEMLMLMEIQIPLEQANFNDAQMRDAMRQNQQQGPRNLQIESSEERRMTIRGQEVGVVFAKGKDASSGAEFRQVMTAFPGKGGTAMLLLQIPEGKWDEEEAVRILESIE